MIISLYGLSLVNYDQESAGRAAESPGSLPFVNSGAFSPTPKSKSIISLPSVLDTTPGLRSPNPVKSFSITSGGSCRKSPGNGSLLIPLQIGSAERVGGSPSSTQAGFSPVDGGYGTPSHMPAPGGAASPTAPTACWSDTALQQHQRLGLQEVVPPRGRRGAPKIQPLPSQQYVTELKAVDNFCNSLATV